MRWSRRRLIGTAATAAAAAVGAEAGWGEPRRLMIEWVTLEFPDLPVGLDGLRMVQLSDLHRSPWVGQAEIERAVALTTMLEPELIVLTGDFVSLASRYAKPCAAALAALRAPLGRFAVLGNHDYWVGASVVTTALQDAGLTVLRNQARAVRRGGSTLWLIGIDDATVHRHDIAAALQGVPREAFKVALLHEPDVADEVARYPVQLQLSGHSHGGQVRLPGIGPILLPRLGRKYPMGWRRIGRLQLYTNRGVGRVQPAVRFHCPPEVTLITLRHA